VDERQRTSGILETITSAELHLRERERGEQE
jgi:hypothetical protein